MLDWVILAVGLLTAIYWYMTWHYGHWKSQGVYTAPGAVPGAGHLWDALILRRSVNWIHSDLYQLSKGHPAVGIYSFRKPALLLRHPNLIQAVLISEFSNFYDNAREVDENLDPYLGKNPFFLKGQRWKTLRQQLTPAFSSAKIKSISPLIQRVCQEFNSYMEKHQDEDINVLHITGMFTSEVVAKCGFGLDGNVFNDPNAEFYQQGHKFMNYSVYSPIMMLFMQFFPIINKLIRKGFAPQEVNDFFSSMIKQTADYRAKYPEKAPDNDYLQFLLNLKTKNPEFTIEDVIAQCMTFFVDGFETSSVVVSFAIYELTVNPGIQEALREEIKAMDSFSYENISGHPFLERVIQETLRKYTTFPFMKQCTKDCVLQAEGHSYPVYRGQQVIVPLYAIHHDPDIYPDPDRFDPNRFLPQEVKNRHPITYLGFGAGPRTCIGNRFGSFQIKMLLASIVSNFKLLKGDKTAEKIILSPHHIFPVPEKGIWVQFQKLN